MDSFKKAVLKTIRFLEKEKIEYLILGGVAIGVIGEPRFTRDLDLDIFLPKREVPGFLKKAGKASFQISQKEAATQATQFGCFKMFYEGIQVDVILASTELERAAFERGKKIVFFDKPMLFPSPEDLILLKLIPGRPKDLIDVESIVLRHREKLDLRYLREWVRRICDEAEDFRVYHLLEKLLKL